MNRTALLTAISLTCAMSAVAAQSPSTEGPYKVLQRAKVGGEGGTDYIYADVAGRRLYITRGGARAVAATISSPAVAATEGRISIFDLETLVPLGEIPNTGGHGVAVDAKSGHGFSSSKPVSMFDVKTMAFIKSIDVGAAQPDGIYNDAFDGRTYVFSHPTKNATVIDSKDGAVLGTIDLGGVPEQGVSDGKGTLYVVMQDSAGSVAVVDTKTMKTTAHYPFGDIGRCNGLALDAKNGVLFAACGAGRTAGQPAGPVMVILSTKDGKILATLPLAGSSDGAVFNPKTMEAFSSQGNGTLTVVKEKSPTSFEVIENLQTMDGARTLTLDTKSGHIFVMSVERGPVPTPAPGATPGGRGPRAPLIPGSFTIVKIGG